MTTEKMAEEYVEKYFRIKRRISLLRKKKGERGFDFRDNGSTIFVEVKGTAAKKLDEISFRYFTNSEYEKAKECLSLKKSFEVHLVTGLGSDLVRHYCIPAKVLIAKAKPEISWFLPIRKEIGDYIVPD
jgi:hypothetical protein